MNSRDSRQDDGVDRGGAANAEPVDDRDRSADPEPENDRDGHAEAANDVHTTLAAWRESGSHTHDPVRFRFIESLAQRAEACSGPARELLDARIRGLVDGYRDDLLKAESPACSAEHADQPDNSATAQGTDGQDAPVAQDAERPDITVAAQGTDQPDVAVAAQDADQPDIATVAQDSALTPAATLATLLAYIAGRIPAQAVDPVDQEAAARRAAYPEIPDLDYFKKAWSLVSSDTQLRQSSEQVHENAGPLNSSRLVHQSLLLMRELSPGYLHQFLSYADALSWMDQLTAALAPAAKEASKAAAPRKGARAKG